MIIKKYLKFSGLFILLLFGSYAATGDTKADNDIKADDAKAAIISSTAAKYYCTKKNKENKIIHRGKVVSAEDFCPYYVGAKGYHHHRWNGKIKSKSCECVNFDTGFFRNNHHKWCIVEPFLC